MSKPMWVAIFLVGGILLFAAGLFFIGSRKQVFSHHFDLYADFNNIDTLTSGAKVRVSGMDAGQVTDITIPQTPSGRFRLTLKVDTKFHQIIRTDSVASIETSGMVGNKYVDIKKGSDHAAECPQDCYLKTEEPFEMGALMRQGSGMLKDVQSTIDDLHHHADTTIDNIGHAAGHADGMIVAVRGDVKRITSNGGQIASNANQIVADVKQGQGAAGKLLADPTVASNVSQTISHADAASGNFEETSKKVDDILAQVQRQDLPPTHQTIANAQDMTKQLDKAVGTFLAPNDKNENTAQAMRETILGAQHATTNLADDTAAIKHNFFLRGFFKRRGYYSMTDLTPEKYDSTEFVKKPHDRVWIAAAGMFDSGEDGAPQLTNQGRAIIDQNMSDLLPYLPNNPVMVEGYAAIGSEEQRYLVSRQRAIDVRDYLEKKYKLNPTTLGVMPLGDKPPARTGKTAWSGVCLVLVVSKK